MKKLLSLFAATGLVASMSATVVACTNPEEPTGPVDEKQELADIIVIKELGGLREKSEEVIIEAIMEINGFQTGFDSHIEFVGEPGPTSAVLRAKESSYNYKGETTVTYTVNKNFKIQEEDQIDKYNTYHLVKNEAGNEATGELNIEYQEGDEINYRKSGDISFSVINENIRKPGILTLTFIASDLSSNSGRIYLTFYSEYYNDLEIIIGIPTRYE